MTPPLTQPRKSKCREIQIEISPPRHGSINHQQRQAQTERGSLLNRHVQWHRTAVARRAEAKQNCVGCFFALVRSSGSLAAVSVDTKVATRHIGTRLAVSKRPRSKVQLQWLTRTWWLEADQHADKHKAKMVTPTYTDVLLQLAIIWTPGQSQQAPCVSRGTCRSRPRSEV